MFIHAPKTSPSRTSTERVHVVAANRNRVASNCAVLLVLYLASADVGCMLIKNRAHACGRRQQREGTAALHRMSLLASVQELAQDTVVQQRHVGSTEYMHVVAGT